jgi:hypothetical protein
MAKGGRKKEQEPSNELERMVHETKIYKNGKEIFVSEEMRRKLFGVLEFLPLRKVLDRGYTLDDRKRLIPREAAAVSMRDERILTDIEFQKETKEYLLKRRRLEDSFQMGELEKDENALYALFFLAHEWVKNYTPKKEKAASSMLERADKGETDLREELFGKKSKA